MIRRLLVLAACVLAAPPLHSEDRVEWAKYRFTGRVSAQIARPVESFGYRVVLGSPDGKALEATVIADGSPLPDEARLPVEPRDLSREAAAVLAEPLAASEDLERLSRSLIRNARTVLEAIESVIGYTSRRIKYEPPTGTPETAAGSYESGRGSCVGRSLLAADLLLRAGIPARQVTGILIASTESEVAPAARPFFSAELGGVRHRWIEAYVPGLGWIPSDPGGLSNAVTSRHLPLKSAPGRDFGVLPVERSAELSLSRINLFGTGTTLGRLRASAVEVTALTPLLGSIVLAPVPGKEPAEPSRIARANGKSVRFERVPVGDYKLIWKTADGKVEAASLRVDGPSQIELPTGGGRR